MAKEDHAQQIMDRFEELNRDEQKAMLRIFVDMFLEMVEKANDKTKSQTDLETIKACMQDYEMVINIMTKPILPNMSSKKFLLHQGYKLLDADKKDEILS